METVKNVKFLSKHISEKLKWSNHTDTVVKKARHRLFNLKKFSLSPRVLTVFYRSTVESILSGCITAWYGNSTTAERKALQWVVRSAERTIGCTLPALQDNYNTRCRRKAKK
jgi:hypothetical protein